MTHKKDYLNALTTTAIFIMFGPFIFQLLMAIITGNGIPQNIDHDDVTVITYVGGFFFFTGFLLLLYVFCLRVIEGVRLRKN